MEHLHEELRRARESAGLSQQTLADRAGIPRNQVVRAERGENITLDTLRKIAVQLPLTELTLLDTTELRIDAIPEPEKLLMAAVENVVRQTEALRTALGVAMQASRAAEAARRATPPLPGLEPSASIDSLLMLRNLARLVDEIDSNVKIA